MNSKEVRSMTKDIWNRGEKALQKTIFDFAWDGDFKKVKELLL